jgi:nitrous oxidase accessory protein NosD
VRARYDPGPVSRSAKRGLLLAAVAVAAALLGTAGGAGAASVLVVDDDAAQCPNAGYNAIADAIAAASDGDTIVVCPGTYPQTTVDKRVSVVGYTQELSKLSRCSDDVEHPADQVTEDTLVAGFVVAADFVTIRGFTLTGADNGVLIPSGSNGEWVTRNVFQDNTVGLNLNGTTSFVDRNCFRHNNESGSAAGTGIYSDQGLTATTIESNVFFSHDAAAMTLLDSSGAGTLDDLSVTKNVSSQDGDLLSIAGATNSTISQNTSTLAVGSGLFLEAGTGGPNSALTISNNSLTNGADEGIFVDTAALANSTIKSNKTKGNATFGIHVAAGNTDNSITKNDFKNGGAANDCQDDSVGSGTAGTANTWKKDNGKTSFPAGICKKK